MQGTAGTAEESVRYSWNYALLLAKGPSRDALIAEPNPAIDGVGRDRRPQELAVYRGCAGTLITILSEKTLPVPELATPKCALGAASTSSPSGRQQGCAASTRCRAHSKRRFNTVVLPTPDTLEEEVSIVQDARGLRRQGAAATRGGARARGDPTHRDRISRAARRGKTGDGKAKLGSPSGTLSTAEAISVVSSGMALAGHFGDGSLTAQDVASGWLARS